MDQNSDYTALRDGIMAVPHSGGVFKRTASMLTAVKDTVPWLAYQADDAGTQRIAVVNDYWCPVS